MGFNSLKGAMAIAARGMDAQAFRMRVVSENLSNADTHGYQRKQIAFQTELDAASTATSRALGSGVSVKSVTLDRTPSELAYDPGHPLADERGFVALSNVNMMLELADAQEASRSYEANLSTFRQATQMYSGLLNLLRK